MLTPKAFGVLRYLVEHAGRLVTQDELLEALWPATYVNPEVLRKYILEIRRVLGDRPDPPIFSGDISLWLRSSTRELPERCPKPRRKESWAANLRWHS